MRVNDLLSSEVLKRQKEKLTAASTPEETTTNTHVNTMKNPEVEEGKSKDCANSDMKPANKVTDIIKFCNSSIQEKIEKKNLLKKRKYEEFLKFV